jgi:hypothetical protein
MPDNNPKAPDTFDRLAQWANPPKEQPFLVVFDEAQHISELDFQQIDWLTGDDWEPAEK